MTTTLLRRALPRALLVAGTPRPAVQSRVIPVPVAVRRMVSTATDTLDSSKFHRLSDATIETLMDSLDELGEQVSIARFDATYSNGVVTLSLGNLGTYVVNKQPANRQIWLSSPLSGPKRYNYDSARRAWVYSHDGESLDELLRRELKELLRMPIKLDLTIS